MKFVPNPAFVAQFSQSLAEKRLKDEAAEEIAARAKAIAPVDTGEYRESIHTGDGQVISDAPHAAVLEFGAGNKPTFATFRRAATELYGARALRRR